MRPVPFNQEKTYSVCLVNKHPYLFIDIRITRESVPEGLFVYDIADADGDGCFARIQPFVFVDYYGTIIGKHELEMDRIGSYYPTYGSNEYEGYFVGEMTLEEYLSADPEEFGEMEEAEDGGIFLYPGHCYKMRFLVESLYFENGIPIKSKKLDTEGIKDDIRENMDPDLEIIDLAVNVTDTEGVKAELSVTFRISETSIGVRTMAAVDMFKCCDGVEIYTDEPFAEVVQK